MCQQVLEKFDEFWIFSKFSEKFLAGSEGASAERKSACQIMRVQPKLDNVLKYVRKVDSLKYRSFGEGFQSGQLNEILVISPNTNFIMQHTY